MGGIFLVSQLCKFVVWKLSRFHFFSRFRPNKFVYIGWVSLIIISMDQSLPVLIFITAFWGAVGGILPTFVPRSSERGIITTAIVMTAVCCYSMWLFTWLSQLNPLVGPQVNGLTQLLMDQNWNAAASS